MTPIHELTFSATEAPDFLQGGGEMSRLIAAKDWSNTPLGPIHLWPQSLRTTVSLCLASNFPISMAWGRSSTQIYNDGYWPICGAKHPRAMGEDFRECWASAWPVIGEAFESAWNGKARFLENQRMFLDRNGYLEETFFTFSFSPVRDESGKVGGLFHPVIETTAQMLSERRIKLLRDMTESATSAHSVLDCCQRASATFAESPFDLPFVLLYLLDEESESLRLAGIVGIEPGKLTTPTEIHLAGKADPWPVASVLRSGKPQIVEDFAERLGLVSCGPYPEPPNKAIVMPVPRPGASLPAGVMVAGVSSRLPFEASYRSFFDLVVGQFANALSNVRAHEEERRRAEALAEVDRAKTVFFSNISHEFRTPLTLMLGPLREMLDRPAENTNSSAEELNIVYRNGLRLLRLVNALLEFSRLEAGRVQAEFEPVDLAAFTAELASLFRAAVEKAGIHFNVDCAPLSQEVSIDRSMWEKIVLNLLSNAFKFTFHGEIGVTLREYPEGVELLITDTGTGIPPDALPHLFERFYQVENAHGRSVEGTGIGLSMVKELVKLHGGRVQVESKPGAGSTFTVILPGGLKHRAHHPRGQFKPGLAKSTPQNAAGADYIEEALRWLPSAGEEPSFPIAEPPPAARPETKKGRILLADDNADMRLYVKRVLATDFEVDAVVNGEEALQAVLADPPDLVLSDIMMPKLDGLGLLAALRANERTRGIPVVLLSARAGEEARVEGLQSGADDYLTKPFGARELLARVRTNVELSKLRSELLRQEEGHRTAEQMERQWRMFDNLLSHTADHIWQLDRQGRFTYANRALLDLWKKDVSAVVGGTIFDIGLRFAEAQVFHEQWRYVATTGQPVRKEVEFPDPNTGKTVWYEYIMNPIAARDGSVDWVAGISRDITERKIAENQLKTSLLEKTALLREVHHRVKNNLQIISSLLSMQASKLSDDFSVIQLRDSERRVMSMALIHEQLYAHDDMASIDLASYVHNLVSHVFSSQNYSSAVQCIFELTPTILTVEQAIPCGLILNELITNALKYAYPAGQGGTITVAISDEDGFVTVSVRDHGIGLPDNLDVKQSLGMQLVDILSNQLDGTAEFTNNHPGAAVTIRFRKLIR